MSHTRKRLKRPRRRFVVRYDYAAGLGNGTWDWAVWDTTVPDAAAPDAVFLRKRDAQDWARQKNKVICGHS